MIWNGYISQNLRVFIWSFLKGYKWKIYGICLAVLIASLLTVIDPYLLKILIDKITVNNIHLNFFSDKNYLIQLIALFITLNICSNFIWRIINYLSLKTFPAVRSRVFSETFSYLSLHSHQYFQANLAGDLAKHAIFEYIEVFYNRIRMHSTNDYLSPVKYEEIQKCA